MLTSAQALTLVWGVSASLFGLATGLLILTLMLRWWSQREASFNQAVRRQWLPEVLPVLGGERSFIKSRLPERQVPEFCRLWCSLFDLVSGASADRLRRLGTELELARSAEKLLQRGFDDRLLAITVLGNLKDPGVKETLEQILSRKKENPVLALAALQSLYAIDPQRGLEWLIPGRRRFHWPAEQLVGVLADDSQGTAKTRLWPLVETTETVPDRAFLLRLVAALNINPGAQALDRLTIQHATEPEVLQRLLPLFNHSRLHYRARILLRHRDVGVRVQAVRAMQRLGRPSDRRPLLKCLTDPNWWVRYRAAQALVCLPGMTAERLSESIKELQDSFALQALEQAQSELAWESESA